MNRAGKGFRPLIVSVKFKMLGWSNKFWKLIGLKIKNLEMEITNRAIKLLFVEMRCEIIAFFVLMYIKSVDRLNGNRKQECERKNRCNENHKRLLFQHYCFLNKNPIPIDRSIFFSNHQKNSNWPKTHPKNTKST